MINIQRSWSDKLCRDAQSQKKNNVHKIMSVDILQAVMKYTEAIHSDVTPITARIWNYCHISK